MTEKKKPGRPRFKVNNENKKQVETLSGLGLPQEQIASVIGCSVDTMVVYFKDEILKGRAKANTNISQMLYKKATGGDTTALIFWAKTQMRWKETDKLEITGKDDGPVLIEEAKAKLLANIKDKDNE